MKYISAAILSLLVGALVIPSGAEAHGMMMNGWDAGDRGTMMQYIEDSALGDELHEEMQNLMTKMMNGTMSQEEAVRMSELMDQYPGPYGMMMNRMGQNGWNTMHGWRNMSWCAGIWQILIMLSWLVWTIAGILVIAWLWKKVRNA